VLFCFIRLDYIINVGFHTVFTFFPQRANSRSNPLSTLLVRCTVRQRRITMMQQIAQQCTSDATTPGIFCSAICTQPPVQVTAYLGSECSTAILKFHNDASIYWSKEWFPLKNEEPSRNPTTCFCGTLGFRGNPVEEHWSSHCKVKIKSSWLLSIMWINSGTRASQCLTFRELEVLRARTVAVGPGLGSGAWSRHFWNGHLNKEKAFAGIVSIDTKKSVSVKDGKL